jgi:hypothetical protein
MVKKAMLMHIANLFLFFPNTKKCPNRQMQYINTKTIYHKPKYNVFSSHETHDTTNVRFLHSELVHQLLELRMACSHPIFIFQAEGTA